MDLKRIINNNQVALYGLSTETERVLVDWDNNYNVIGLLDGFKDSGMQFGYPILNINDVVKREDVIIVVVARPGSCKAIVKRIGDLCRDNNVAVYDIRGKNLLEEVKSAYDFISVKGYKKDDLIEQIKQVDVVSFDLFDTLVVRNVLTQSDILELVNCKAKEVRDANFVNKRIKSEKVLSIDNAPYLLDIYKDVFKNHIDAEGLAAYYADLEFHTEMDTLQSRRDMVEVLRLAKKLGKRVYITSESYYSKFQIDMILEKCDITMFDDIIVSCEYNTGKTAELFDKLKEVAESDNILHIGDDIVADIESANRHGVQSFQIYSASELLDSLGGVGLTLSDLGISERVRVGMFIANIFNSPFQFEDNNRRMHVDDAYDLGYLFAAPIIIDFVKWFGDKVRENNISNIWFCARDGYLIRKIFRLLYPDMKSEYFLTSRTAAIRAGINDAEDLEYVESMKFGGSIAENLRVRFGIDESSIDVNEIDDSRCGIMKYEKAILRNARIKRANYLKYIQSLEALDGQIALFDFVAKGTSQMYIDKIIGKSMLGLYFIQLEPQFMSDKGLGIIPFYSETEKDDSVIFDNYYVLETILTSPMPSVLEFDKNGVPIYAQETRSNADIECVIRMQEGIISYVKTLMLICPKSVFAINKKLDETFFQLLNRVEIRDADFLNLYVEDPFFNRMTNIKDIL